MLGGNRSFYKDQYGHSSGAKRGTCQLLFALICACIAMADGHGWRDRKSEVASIKTLSPPGLVNSYCPPYKSHLYKNNTQEKHIKPESNVKVNTVKEETDIKGLRLVTINVTSWSPKIITMISKMSKEYDIILIQEHHKFRKRDMKTGPYIIGASPLHKELFELRMVVDGIPQEEWPFWFEINFILKKINTSRSMG